MVAPRRMGPVIAIVLLCFTTTPSLAQRFTPVAFTLPPPPSLAGALSPNYALYNVEKLHNRRIMGPTSFAFLNGSVYTVTADRKVVDVATCIPRVVVSLSPLGCRTQATCGLLSSIRVGSDGMLLVLDAYRGMYQVNPANGAVKQLYSSTKPVGGRVPKYLNDFVQTADGIILISDSSDKFDALNDIYIIMEGRASGRILALNPTTGAITEVLRDVIVYPNGLELTADGTALLVAETGRARILRVSLLAATYKQITTFANNLPGVPGNIRRSSRGTFWVTLSLIRHRGIPNSMDMFSNNVAARMRTVNTVDQNTIKSYYPKYGLVVELDPTGKIIGSLHDPSGQVYSSVSEASEQGGLLYIGSPNTAFTGRIVLPQGDGRIVTVDSVIQVMRSRCQIPEDKLEQAKIVLNRYIEQQTGIRGQDKVTPQPIGTTRPLETGTPQPQTPGPTQSQTPGPTQSQTPGPTQSQTPGPTQSQTPGPTQSQTPGPTQSQTPGPTQSQTPGPTQSQTPGPTQSQTPGPTQSQTPGPTQSQTPGPTQSQTPEPTQSQTPGINQPQTPEPTGAQPTSTSSPQEETTTGPQETASPTPQPGAITGSPQTETASPPSTGTPATPLTDSGTTDNPQS